MSLAHVTGQLWHCEATTKRYNCEPAPAIVGRAISCCRMGAVARAEQRCSSVSARWRMGARLRQLQGRWRASKPPVEARARRDSGGSCGATPSGNHRLVQYAVTAGGLGVKHGDGGNCGEQATGMVRMWLVSKCQRWLVIGTSA